MSEVALPVGLPPGVAGDTGEQLQTFLGDADNPPQFNWKVASGEAWLLQTVSGLAQKGAAGSAVVQVIYFDQDSNLLGTISQPVALAGGNFSFFTFGVGLTSSTTNNGGGEHPSQEGLPWLVMTPGYKFRLDLDGGIVIADSLQQVQYTYTKWDYGGGASAGGPQPLGPYMWVPGPSAGAVAA